MGSEPSTESTDEGDRAMDGACANRRRPYAAATLVRDWAVAVAVIAGLYGLLYAIPVPPFGVPGYLLIVAFDWLEPVLPSFASSAAYDAGFAGFLGVLAVLAAVAASWARSRGVPGGWRVGVAAGCWTVGAVGLALASGVFVRYSRGDYVPLLLVVGTSLALVWVGRSLAVGRLGRRPG